MLLIAAMMMVFARYAPPASTTEGAPAHARKKITAVRDQMPIKYKKPMQMTEPMTTGMAKSGMKKGDVKKHAEMKETRMNEEMQQEEMKQ